MVEVPRGEGGTVKQVLLYLPVVHAGYEQFFSRHGDAGEILLLGQGFLQADPSLSKDKIGRAHV